VNQAKMKYINKLKGVIKTLFQFPIAEIFWIFLLLLLTNNYLGNNEKLIVSDGVGYYDYLPSAFIHKDLFRYHKGNESSTKRIDSLDFYVDQQEYKANKYPAGTALMQSPFFGAAYLQLKNTGEITGYEPLFHTYIFYAGLVYLFIALILIRKLLTTFHLARSTILISQFALLFSTQLLWYSSQEPTFSHLYSFVAISAFALYWRIYLAEKKAYQLILVFILFGIIVLIRPINIIVLAFLPFLSNSWQEFKQTLAHILTNKKWLLIGTTCFTTIVSIQFILWYFQTGNWLIYSYTGEGFNFNNPQMINILFSFKKGLFIYTPVILIFSLVSLKLLFNKGIYQFLTWILAMVLITFVLSSWWSWYYGCSFGLRAYIEYYPFFAIPFALAFNQCNKAIKFMIILGIIFTAYLNIIQSYQYKNYIIHWIEMDKESYQKTFMKTSDEFKGILWKPEFNESNSTRMLEKKLQDFSQKEYETKTIISFCSEELTDFSTPTFLLIKLHNEFKSDEKAKIIVSVNQREPLKPYYWHSIPLIHFANKSLNKMQDGNYSFIIEPIENIGDAEIKIELATDKNPVNITHPVISIFKQNQDLE